MFTPNEIWKDINGNNGRYQVSNLGKVKSLKNGKEKIIKGGVGKNGHSVVNLRINGIQSGTNISRIVAIHFIPNPDNLPYACHKDETLIDGRLYNGEDNLYWGTQSDNIKDCFNKGRGNNGMKGKFGKDSKHSRIIYQYALDGTFIKKWESIIDIQRELGIPAPSVCTCCRGRQKTTNGFIWSYTLLNK